jgi:hypothetical protein
VPSADANPLPDRYYIFVKELEQTESDEDLLKPNVIHKPRQVNRFLSDESSSGEGDSYQINSNPFNQPVLKATSIIR